MTPKRCSSCPPPLRCDHRELRRAGRLFARAHRNSDMRLNAARSLLLCMLACAPVGAQRAPADFEALPFAPRSYVCYRAPSRFNIDGRLDESVWAAASWSDAFVDIEGDNRPRPQFRTRVKMAWDDEYFYVAA